MRQPVDLAAGLLGGLACAETAFAAGPCGLLPPAVPHIAHGPLLWRAPYKLPKRP